MTTIWFCTLCHASGVLEHAPAANIYALLDWVTALHRAHPRAAAIRCPQQGRDLRVFDDAPALAPAEPFRPARPDVS